MTELSSHKAVCRIAPAVPGLLITGTSQKVVVRIIHLRFEFYALVITASLMKLYVVIF